MATVRTKGKTTQTTAKKGTAKKTAAKVETKAAETGDVKVDMATVAAAVNRLPAPSEAEVTAWRAQYPEGYVLELAAQTRATNVVGEAWGWFQKAEPVLTGELASAIRYPATRLAFLGRTILDLAGALEAERAKKRSTVTLVKAVDAAEALAGAALAELRGAMREAAGRHPTMTADLKARLGESSASTTAGALRALAALLASWMTGDDPVVRELARSARLTETDTKNARAHADAVTQASTVRRGANSADRDTPEVSGHEGRVLAEMRVLRNAFRNARALRDDKRIPALTPGAATRAVFTRSGPADDEGEPQPPPVG